MIPEYEGALVEFKNGGITGPARDLELDTEFPRTLGGVEAFGSGGAGLKLGFGLDLDELEPEPTNILNIDDRPEVATTAGDGLVVGAAGLSDRCFISPASDLVEIAPLLEDLMLTVSVMPS